MVLRYSKWERHLNYHCLQLLDSSLEFWTGHKFPLVGIVYLLHRNSKNKMYISSFVALWFNPPLSYFFLNWTITQPHLLLSPCDSVLYDKRVTIESKFDKKYYILPDNVVTFNFCLSYVKYFNSCCNAINTYIMKSHFFGNTAQFLYVSGFL